MMKKIISLLLVATFILALTACSKADKGRINYNLKLEKYLTLCEYEGLAINKNGNEYKKAYESTIASDVESYDLHEKITEGKKDKDGKGGSGRMLQEIAPHNRTAEAEVNSDGQA